jgi:hypothetical protein
LTLFSDELTVGGVRLELLRPSSPEALIDEEAFADVGIGRIAASGRYVA